MRRPMLTFLMASCSLLALGVGGAQAADLVVTGSQSLPAGTSTYDNTLIGVGTPGVLTVSGAGTALVNSGAANVGVDASGTLAVTGGATVSSATGSVGGAAGTFSSVTLVGPGSAWTVGNELVVGSNGAATLLVAGGAALASMNAVLGDLTNNASGTVTVTGAGSSWTNSGTISVGGFGTGNLSIADGGSVATGALQVGGLLSPSATLTLDGAGSRLDVSGDVSVGTNGMAAVTAGAMLTTTGNGYLGIGVSAATGSMTVTGAGARWAVAGDLTVGDLGQGAMTIADGGVVTTGGAAIIGFRDSVGQVGVLGAGSLWTIGGALKVGGDGQGTLIIANGARVSNTDATVGQLSAPGLVAVSGAGSRWDNAGTVTINTDGAVLLSDGAVGTSQVTLVGNGLGAPIAQLGLSGAGTHWTATDGIVIGYGGYGTLSITDGAHLTSGLGAISYFQGTPGEVFISGADSRWDSGVLYVGYLGDAALSVSGGASVSADDAVIGYQSSPAPLPPSNGVVAIDGAGSGFVVKNNLYIGFGGTGELDVSGGASVRSGTAGIGISPGAAGLVSVAGAGSTWAVDGGLYLGTGGTGTLTITQGGAVSAQVLSIADGGNMGQVTVSGAGSTLTVATQILMGGVSSRLTLAEGGSATAAQVLMGQADGPANARLVIGADTGAAAVAPGTLNAAAVTVVNGTGVLVFNHTASAYAFAPTIAGGAQVEVDAGTTRLAGSNSYSGGTVLNGGTLIGTAASFGTGAILDNGTLVLDQASMGTFANTLTGSGALVKTGAGTVTLASNAAAFAGTTTISGGTLALAGALGGTVRVTAGGTLAGNGSTGSLSVGGGGVVAPGNSIGTIAVSGSFSQAAGSLYQVEIQSGRADLIAVGGMATLAPGAQLAISSLGGLYTPGTRMTILTAAGGVSGSYTLVGDTSVSAFYGVAALSDAVSVLLEVTQDRPFATAAVTANQAAVARALDTLPTGNTLHDAIGSLSSFAAARTAFGQMAGDLYGTLQSTALTDSHFARDVVIARLRVPEGTGAWAQGFGSWGSVAGTADAGGVDRTIGGFFTGIDGAVDATYRLGVFAGYSQSQFTQASRAASADADTAHVGIYGAGQWDAWALRAGAAYAYAALDTTRLLAIPNLTGGLAGSLNQQTAQVFADLGYRINTGPLAFEPFAGLAYVHVATGGFAESGGLAALSGTSAGTDATFTTLGLRLGAEGLAGAMPLRFDATAGWRHAFGDTSSDVSLAFTGSAPFTIAGVPLARDVLGLETGLSLAFTPAMTVAVSYSGQWGDGLTDNGLTARLAVKF